MRTAKWGFPLAVIFALLPLSSASAQQEDLPEGVTAVMLEEGEQVFGGPGVCATCHGTGGEGTPLAPSLTDDEWLNIDGTYEAIVELVNDGVPEPQEHPTPMLPKGGSEITEEQVRAVAAYVWSLSQGGGSNDD